MNKVKSKFPAISYEGRLALISKKIHQLSNAQAHFPHPYTHYLLKEVSIDTNSVEKALEFLTKQEKLFKEYEKLVWFEGSEAHSDPAYKYCLHCESWYAPLTDVKCHCGAPLVKEDIDFLFVDSEHASVVSENG